VQPLQKMVFEQDQLLWLEGPSFQQARSFLGSDKALFAPGSGVLVQTTLKPTFPDHVTHNYKNVIVDFVIGGDISLRAIGGMRFKELL
jgi:hypothetical protein